MDQPFMEHPVGDFKNAVEAMSDAIDRLRKLAVWPAAIVFSAQGYGGKPESYQFAEVRLEGSRLSVEGGPFDLSTLRKLASVGPTAIVAQGPEYSVEGVTPQEATAIIDAIFRHRFGTLPFPDEGDDYPDAGGRRGGVGGMSAMPTSRRFPSISPHFRDPKRSTTPAPYGNATGNLEFPLDEPILMPRIANVAKALAKHTAGSP